VVAGHGVEPALRPKASERGEHHLVPCAIVGEISRITDHLTCLGASAMEVGGFTPFLWMIKIREWLWELLEELHADGSTVLVVISDWLMPVTRGDAFLDELKSKFPGIKRVLLTGQADEEALRRVRDRDLVDLMLHKPWSEQDIRDVMALVPPCDGP